MDIKVISVSDLRQQASDENIFAVLLQAAERGYKFSGESKVVLTASLANKIIDELAKRASINS